MYVRRLTALRDVLKEKKLDALLVFTNEDGKKNIRYLTGFGGSFAALLLTRRNAYLGTDGRYTVRAKKEVQNAKILAVSSDRRARHSAHAIRQIMERAKLRRGARVGFESHHTSVAALLTWKKEVPARLVPTEGIVERLRQYKDKREIAAIREACRVTDAVFRKIAGKIRAGQRERDVAMFIDHEHRLRGALGPSFPTIVASGPHSAIPHHETGARKLRAGDPVVLDFGGLFPSGYCSDLSRTIFVPGREPDSKLRKIYEVVKEANRKGRESLRVGMTWQEYNRGPAREYIEEEGYGDNFIHSLGHSIGLDVHDPFDYAHDPIREGTVLSCEPGIYIEGFGGVRIEDDLLITPRGVEKFTHASSTV